MAVAAPASQGDAPVAAASPKVPAATRQYRAGPLAIEVTDLSPRFLDFHRRAAGLDADQRFHLWKQRYDFAALPPREDYDQQARTLLDAAWSRYPAALATIRKGERGMMPRVPFAQIARLLGHGAPGNLCRRV